MKVAGGLLAVIGLGYGVLSVVSFVSGAEAMLQAGGMGQLAAAVSANGVLVGLATAGVGAVLYRLGADRDAP